LAISPFLLSINLLQEKSRLNLTTSIQDFNFEPLWTTTCCGACKPCDRGLPQLKSVNNRLPTFKQTL
jgi:NADH:ubiquinone oxidoreductase subunit F (NADH-binding)